MPKNYKIIGGDLHEVEEFEGQVPPTETSPDDFAGGIVAAPPTEEDLEAEEESIKKQLEELTKIEEDKGELTPDQSTKKKELEERLAEIEVEKIAEEEEEEEEEAGEGEEGGDRVHADQDLPKPKRRPRKKRRN